MIKLKFDLIRLLCREAFTPRRGGYSLTETGRKHLAQLEAEYEEKFGKETMEKVRGIIESTIIGQEEAEAMKILLEQEHKENRKQPVQNIKAWANRQGVLNKARNLFNMAE